MRAELVVDAVTWRFFKSFSYVKLWKTLRNLYEARARNGSGRLERTAAAVKLRVRIPR
jgi:hypothetical protein